MKVLDPGPDIVWLGHDTFKITGEKVIYIDPYQLDQADNADKADIILITHNHYDHLVIADIEKLSDSDTVIVAPVEAGAKLQGHRAQFVHPGDSITVKGIAIEAVPAYNINKFSKPGVVFHPKEDGKVGYLIDISGRRVYHAGDTDFIPEMKGISCDIALLPVSGAYVMTADECVQAANTIKPKVAIPMHYGAIVGDKSNAEHFRRGCTVPVTILNKGEA